MALLLGAAVVAAAAAGAAVPADAAPWDAGGSGGGGGGGGGSDGGGGRRLAYRAHARVDLDEGPRDDGDTEGAAAATAATPAAAAVGGGAGRVSRPMVARHRRRLRGSSAAGARRRRRALAAAADGSGVHGTGDAGAAALSSLVSLHSRRGAARPGEAAAGSTGTSALTTDGVGEPQVVWFAAPASQSPADRVGLAAYGRSLTSEPVAAAATAAATAEEAAFAKALRRRRGAHGRRQLSSADVAADGEAVVPLQHPPKAASASSVAAIVADHRRRLRARVHTGTALEARIAAGTAALDAAAATLATASAARHEAIADKRAAERALHEWSTTHVAAEEEAEIAALAAEGATLSTRIDAAGVALKQAKAAAAAARSQLRHAGLTHWLDTRVGWDDAAVGREEAGGGGARHVVVATRYGRDTMAMAGGGGRGSSAVAQAPADDEETADAVGTLSGFGRDDRPEGTTAVYRSIKGVGGGAGGGGDGGPSANGGSVGRGLFHKLVALGGWAAAATRRAVALDAHLAQSIDGLVPVADSPFLTAVLMDLILFVPVVAAAAAAARTALVVRRASAAASCAVAARGTLPGVAGSLPVGGSVGGGGRYRPAAVAAGSGAVAGSAVAAAASAAGGIGLMMPASIAALDGVGGVSPAGAGPAIAFLSLLFGTGSAVCGIGSIGRGADLLEAARAANEPLFVAGFFVVAGLGLAYVGLHVAVLGAAVLAARGGRWAWRPTAGASTDAAGGVEGWGRPAATGRKAWRSRRRGGRLRSRSPSLSESESSLSAASSASSASGGASGAPRGLSTAMPSGAPGTTGLLRDSGAGGGRGSGEWVDARTRAAAAHLAGALFLAYHYTKMVAVPVLVDAPTRMSPAAWAMYVALVGALGRSHVIAMAPWLGLPPVFGGIGAYHRGDVGGDAYGRPGAVGVAATVAAAVFTAARRAAEAVMAGARRVAATAAVVAHAVRCRVVPYVRRVGIVAHHGGGRGGGGAAHALHTPRRPSASAARGGGRGRHGRYGHEGHDDVRQGGVNGGQLWD
ncbi:hypothetical protein MMPV_001250 [Pyropia vietnamensis]